MYSKIGFMIYCKIRLSPQYCTISLANQNSIPKFFSDQLLYLLGSTLPVKKDNEMIFNNNFYIVAI